MKTATARTARLVALLALTVSLVSVPEATFNLIGLTVDDPITRDVVERHTLTRNLQPVRFQGTVRNTDWLLDRPHLAATLARHLHPPLERYQISMREDGSWAVNDLGSLRGSLRLVARGANRRIYFCQGQFRSLAHILHLTGNMVFTLDYRDVRGGADPAVEVTGKPLIFFGGGDGVLYAFQPPQASQDSAVQPLKKVWAYDCNPPEYRKRDGKVLPYSNHTKNTPEGPSEIIGIPVFYQGRVYVAIGQSPVHGNGRGCLSCVDAATGAKVWASELIERTLATATIADGLLYIPDCTGNLHCFYVETGDRYWVHPLRAKTWGASAFVADDKVYVGTEANIFWVLQARKTLRVLSKTRLQTVPITPIAAPGVLYSPTQNKLTALAAKPGLPELPEGNSGPHQRP